MNLIIRESCLPHPMLGLPVTLAGLQRSINSNHLQHTFDDSPLANDTGESSSGCSYFWA